MHDEEKWKKGEKEYFYEFLLYMKYRIQTRLVSFFRTNF